MDANLSEPWDSQAVPSKVNGAKKVLIGLLVPLLLVVVLAAVIVVWKMPSSDPRIRVKAENGILLPASAAKIQCRGDAWHGFLDRNAYTVFEMERGEQADFVASLKVTGRELPLSRIPADPIAVNVRGENDYFKSDAGSFEQTWAGDLAPLEMLSCQSPIAADWLHVEFWQISETRLLVKIHSNWN
ncbi:MAG: hypothetical protein ABIT37_11110 [Luteolibacter sp.]